MKEGYRELSVAENRAVQLEILNELDRYCEANGLRYFLIAGTLLGAVRHKGYIPWDDDIDVVMLRQDYDRLEKAYTSEGFYIASYKRLEGYALPFMKLCKSNTLLQENALCTPDAMGINIDIFPVETVPEDKKVRKQLFQKIKAWRRILDVKDTPAAQGRAWYKNMILKAGQVLLAPVNATKVAAAMERLVRKYSPKESSVCASVVWGCGEREVVDTAVFADTTELLFEGRYYKAPAGWEQWLSRRYGDYMKLPPVEQQVTHHSFKTYIKQEEQI